MAKKNTAEKSEMTMMDDGEGVVQKRDPEGTRQSRKGAGHEKRQWIGLQKTIQRITIQRRQSPEGERGHQKEAARGWEKTQREEKEVARK